MPKHTTIDQYISSFPAETQETLELIRSVVHELVPGITETIRYDMPTFMLDDTYLIYMAGWKKHVSIYPFTEEMEGKFPETARYVTSGKGTIQFPLDQPLPVEIIRKIIEFRLKEHTVK